MEPKICTSCKENLPLSSFGIQRGKPKSHCKKCCIAKQREYYSRTKPVRLQKMSEYGKKNRATLQPKDTARMQLRRVRHKVALIQLMGGKCPCCDYVGCREAFDFHHMDESQKSFDIAKNTCRGWEILLAEARKCVLVCCRCHREIHAGVRPCPPYRPF